MPTQSNPVIVALDGMNPAMAMSLASTLKGEVHGFKANDLLDGDETGILDRLAEFGGVFADAKFHDIPNTVGNRVRKLLSGCNRHPQFLTVHASGGIKMIRAAVEAADRVAHDTKILAVTVLTSLGEEDCNLTFGGPIKAAVLKFARWAMMAGAHGIVCSAKELKFLADYPELVNLIRVVPAIRPAWHQEKDDQSKERAMTPAEAFELGAHILVMGRPITKAKDPAEAARRTLEEIQATRQAQ